MCGVVYLTCVTFVQSFNYNSNAISSFEQFAAVLHASALYSDMSIQTAHNNKMMTSPKFGKRQTVGQYKGPQRPRFRATDQRSRSVHDLTTGHMHSAVHVLNSYCLCGQAALIPGVMQGRRNRCG
jgi:hypothetical protein